LNSMAEREGFKPSVPLTGHLISSSMHCLLSRIYKRYIIPSSLNFIAFLTTYTLSSII
jgi:hypothetical protein